MPKGFQKGNKLSPGRPPVLLPEVQKAIDANKNAIKVAIIQELDGKVIDWIRNVIASGSEEGDVIKLKILLELALGKMVTEPPEFEVSEEEKLLVLEFRRRKAEANTNERIVSTESKGTG